MTNCKNHAYLCGRVLHTPTFNYEISGEKFYRFFLDIERLSGVKDVIPITISENYEHFREIEEGTFLEIKGELRSYNSYKKGTARLELSVLAVKISILEQCVYKNNIELTGYVCKKPEFRITPQGRKIANLCVAVNRQAFKSDYLPCICWGKTAVFAEKIPVGTKISLYGRIQSREYQKKISEDLMVVKTTYEVSVNTLSVSEEGSSKP